MTRNSHSPGYRYPSVPSFFLRRDTFTSGLELYSIPLHRFFPGRVALVDLDQLREQLGNEEQRKNIVSLLSRDEVSIFTSFSYPKRQSEWLGGRIAGKAAALLLQRDELSAARMASLSILPSSVGSPQLCPATVGDRRPAVSISHSGKFAAGMAAYASVCGIDIQKISSQTQKVSSRFAVDEEIILLAGKIPALNAIERLTLLWAVKEALKKAFLKEKPGIFQGILLKQLHIDSRISLSLQYPEQRARPALVEAVVLDEYILAFTGGP